MTRGLRLHSLSPKDRPISPPLNPGIIMACSYSDPQGNVTFGLRYAQKFPLGIERSTSCLTYRSTSCLTYRNTSCLTYRNTSCLTYRNTSCLTYRSTPLPAITNTKSKLQCLLLLIIPYHNLPLPLNFVYNAMIGYC